jgi:hypothetical protein
MRQGWIKTHRTLLDWEWHTDPKMVSLLIHLILLANSKNSKWKGVEIKRGQFVTGRRSLSAITGIQEASLRRCLTKLEKSGVITVKTTNRNSVITVCNYDTYQEVLPANDPANDPANGQQMIQQTANKRPTNGQQMIHNKEVKKERKKEGKKETNTNTCRSLTTSVSDFCEAQTDQSAVEKIEPIDFDRFVDWFNAKTKGVFGVLRKPLGEKRRSHMRARVSVYGKDSLREMVEKAIKSDFLRGDNKTGRIFQFDWLILPSNFEKVISGNYDNKTAIILEHNGNQQFNRTNNLTFKQRDELDRGERTMRDALGVARVLAEYNPDADVEGSNAGEV